ncbi:MAG: class I SAM-dependent methyltransferase [Ilumatobacteraceae bacterium]
MTGLDEDHPDEHPADERTITNGFVAGRSQGTHYFDAQPEVRSRRRTTRVVLPDLAFELQTDTGVFSHGRLDPGTKILLSEAPDLPDTGVFLDLGTGAGPIAMTMALRRPQARIWAVDVNERARNLVLDNARRLHLDSILVADPDDVCDRVTGEPVRFDVIWSNPPIKIGKAALHDLLRTWLNRLNENGEAVLVVHKNLGSDSLATWLNDKGWQVRRIASRQGYRVLRVTRKS